MKRYIIKKFKKEFQFWEDTGQIWERNLNECKWWLVTNPIFEDNYVYVIPDKYAELRKAWIEGGQIQSRTECRPEWHNIQNPLWSDKAEYRIKPIWYEDIRKGVICHVWDYDYDINHNDDYIFIGKRTCWRHAEPVMEGEYDPLFKEHIVDTCNGRR